MRKLALALVFALPGVSCAREPEVDHGCWDGPLAPEPRAELLGRGVSAFEIALDESDVYLADLSGIVRVPKSGGVPALLYRGALAHLTVDADSVFWTESFGTRAIYAMDKRSLVITKLLDDLDDAGAIVADGDLATAFARGAAPATSSSKFIYWVDEKTGAVRRLASRGTPEVVVPGSGGVYLVRLDQERVYWTTEHPFSISSQLIDGGDPKTVAMNASVLTFALDASDVFFDGFDGGLGLGRFSKPAGAPAAVDSGSVTRVAADGTTFFWTAHQSCEVRAFDKASNMTRAIAANQARPSALAVDATHAYWTNIFDGTVMRAPK